MDDDSIGGITDTEVYRALSNAIISIHGDYGGGAVLLSLNGNMKNVSFIYICDL